MGALHALVAAVLIPIVILAACPAASFGQSHQEEPVGVRPYELEWAGRTQDDHPPLVDFENLDGWTVVTKNAAATFGRTREQQIWGRYVGKLTYRGEGSGPNEVRIVPPQPIPISQPFDAVTLWCYGNNWGWAPDPGTPQVRISVLFEDSDGQEFAVYLYHVDWTEWYLLHRRLTPEQARRLQKGAKFAGILVAGGRQKDDRILYFDNLAVFTEEFPPLTFAPRPERGISMFPGQTAGTNTGPGKLPFPTSERTILPPVLDPRPVVETLPEGQGARFRCRDRTGVVEYTVRPETGRWDDIAVTYRKAGNADRGVRFQPCVDGGVWLRGPSGAVRPERGELLSSQFDQGVLETQWNLTAGDVSAKVTYRFRLYGKTLVVDVLAPGGNVAEVRYGRAVGLQNPRLVTHPFYPAEGGRPATVVADTPSGPLFLMGNTDWYRTNASIMWAHNAVDASAVTYNGGTRYIPLTNGHVNDCFERFFITVSPVFEETLPTIANPPSPWKHITGTHVWRAHGAGNREADKKLWAEVRRYGIRKVVVTDHETMWRDGGESFTFRTRAAPGKGGDEGARDYSRYMQDTLGFVYGPYNNFTDFAPVNEYWSTDMVSRDPENQLQHAWMRCYAPKPARAVEYCERLSPVNQAKFGFSTAYCDVHTAVAPWHRVDYDPRVPGAGTMAAVYYSYGEIMLLQKKAWNGPVYSEGNYHAFYCGLTDGNYGQDQAYRPAENPWLVDFDLRRMHDLCCNFGMGNPDMFYANAPQPQNTQAERDAWLDRFLAATVAFGHPGFLVMEGGMGNAMKSYFMLQQLHSRYCLASAVAIRYVDARGHLLSSSEAVASGDYRRSQVVVRYSDGTVVVANGSKTERLETAVDGRKVVLPPNGYCGWTADGKIEVTNWHPEGRYADYAVTPEYIFIDGRGRFTRFPMAAASGMGVLRRVRAGEWELIPYQAAECGFAVAAKSAVALDRDGKEMGAASLRTSRGLTYVIPVEGAFSYLLRGVRLIMPSRQDRATRSAPAKTTTDSRQDGEDLRASRWTVIPGERVEVAQVGRSPRRWTVTIPADAKPGDHVWRKLGDRWLDFIVVEPFATSLSLAGDDLCVTLTSHLPKTETVSVSGLGRTMAVRAEPNKPVQARVPLGPPDKETADLVRVTVQAGHASSTIEAGLRVTLGHRVLVGMPERFVGGVGLRGQPDTPGFGATGAHANVDRGECGGVSKVCLKMHPPWLGGAVGRTFALYDPITLPAHPPAAFRAEVGKLDGSDPGDGILYRVAVVDGDGNEAVAAEHLVKEHRWEAIEADLSRWAGRCIRLRLIADPGPADDTSGDWACWAGMRIETREPALHRTLDAQAERYRRLPSPYPAQGLTTEILRSARRGWLRFDGKGMNAGKYVCYGRLNGVDLGPMPAASGDEASGVYAERVGVELPPAAIASLGIWNRFVLLNPNHDYFSVRRFWIELELEDGRRCSSDIADVTFTQPSDWPYAEGIRLPFGEDITVDIWFRR